jgi:acetyl-CoA carboxylase biotin carboxyl carrier protein
VSDGLSSLKEEDVQRLARLIESLESSTFDYLQLQVGDLRVSIGKGAVPVSTPDFAAGAVAPAFAAPNATTAAAPDAPAYVHLASPLGAPSTPAQPAPPPPQTTPAGNRGTSRAPAGTIDIKSHIMGMFYSQPEPGSLPFVSIGTEVKEDTTICLIEVMKTFNAMTAGVKGVIAEICVKNSQLVEYGQVLFRIRPS